MGIGGIGSISSLNSSSSRQITSSDLKDQKSKKLQNDITEIQRQMQKLSSDEALTATEKAEEKKKLQKEKSNLSTKLQQHQDELLKTQKRERNLAALQEDREPAKEEDSAGRIQAMETASSTDTADETKRSADNRHAMQPGTIISQTSDGTVILKEILNQSADSDVKTQNSQAAAVKEDASAEKEEKTAEDESKTESGLTGNQVQAMVSADSTMQQAKHQGTLVNKTGNDIAVLKSEIKQDALRGADTDKKEAELKEMQKQQKREMAVQFSMMGEANRTAQTASETAFSANSTQIDTERTFHVSGVNASPEDQALQQGFHVSIA